MDFEEVGEEVGPERRLEIGIDEMAAVEGAADSGGGEVFGGGEELVGEKPFLGGRGAGGAVGDYACGVSLTADAGFYEAAAIIQHYHVRHCPSGMRTGLERVGLSLLPFSFLTFVSLFTIKISSSKSDFTNKV